MSQVTQSIGTLIDQLAKLPGIGRKSAERLAYHLLRVPKAEAVGLADAIRDVRENVHYCRACFNLAEGELCTICSDPKRDQSQVCVVEQPRDLMALEQAGVYRGLYHVLLGRIAPLDGVFPEHLTIDKLMDRVRETGTEYVITKHGTPVAKLVPVVEGARPPLFGSMKGTVLAYERPLDPLDAEYDIDRA